ncbi:hypothetical protein Esti_003855 [Eimeria stiedai]
MLGGIGTIPTRLGRMLAEAVVVWPHKYTAFKVRGGPPRTLLLLQSVGPPPTLSQQRGATPSRAWPPRRAATPSAHAAKAGAATAATKDFAAVAKEIRVGASTNAEAAAAGAAAAAAAAAKVGAQCLVGSSPPEGASILLAFSSTRVYASSRRQEPWLSVVCWLRCPLGGGPVRQLVGAPPFRRDSL